MRRDEERSRKPLPPHDDDIEILEIVGVDEDGAPPSAAPAETGDDEAVEIVFEEEVAPKPPPALPPDGVERRSDSVTRERFLRLHADFENLKKRIDRERDDHYRHATGSLVSRLLPVLDNFERALVAARGSGDREALRAGIEMIYRQFLDELRREGLRDIEAIGLAFDPEVHEAVATDVESPLPPNTCVEEMQRGYFFHDRVLRPALVRVSVEGGTDPSYREDA